VFAIKGKGGDGIPYVSPPTKVPIRDNKKITCWLYTIGVDAGKAAIMAGLKVQEPGPKYSHFNRHPDAGYDLNYFNGLLSEKLVLTAPGGATAGRGRSCPATTATRPSTAGTMPTPASRSSTPTWTPSSAACAASRSSQNRRRSDGRAPSAAAPAPSTTGKEDTDHMKTRKTIEIELTGKRERLELYLKREAEMLSGGVQSYGIGSRNLSRYNTDLAAIRAAIKELEDDIAALEALLNGQRPRKAVGVVPRDW